MPQYSIPRHIWRLLYPLVLCQGLFLLTAPAKPFLHGYAVLLSYTIDIIIFVFMWRKIKTRQPQYEIPKSISVTAILAALFSISWHFFIASATDLLLVSDFFQNYQKTAQEMTGSALFLEIVGVCIAAPIAEELLFRGVVFSRLREWMPTWAAILVGSVLFGAMHFKDPFQIPLSITDSVVYFILYLRFRSLWIPIIAHMSFNFAGTLLRFMFWIPGLKDASPWLLMLPSALVLILCAWLLVKQPKSTLIASVPEEAIEDIDTMNAL